MWNTDTLVTEAAKGAPSAGAAVEKYDLNSSTDSPAAYPAHHDQQRPGHGLYGKAEWLSADAEPLYRADRSSGQRGYATAGGLL